MTAKYYSKHHIQVLNMAIPLVGVAFYKAGNFIGIAIPRRLAMGKVECLAMILAGGQGSRLGALALLIYCQYIA